MENPIVFGNNWPNTITYFGENVPSKTGFSVVTHFPYYTHFCHPTTGSLKNGHTPPKIIFRCYFGKMVFSKKLLNLKYLNSYK